MERFLIVNADDFNLTRGVSRGIIKACRDGIVTSTTVLVNLPLASEDVRTLKKISKISAGLHINLSFGKPVRASRGLGKLLDPEGLFRKDFTDWNRLSRASLETEMDAQIRRFRKIFGKDPSHLDSHHHIHSDSHVFKLVLKLSRKYRIPFRLVPALSENQRSALKRKGIFLADYFYGDMNPKKYWRKAAFIGFLKNLPRGITEIMTHPGYVGAGLKRVSSFIEGRRSELNLLCDKKVEAVMSKEKIGLISYRELAGIKKYGKA